MEKPSGIKDITIEYIIAYCEQEDESMEWLKTLVDEEKTNKDGKPRNATFIEIRSEFINKYFPALFSGKPSMRKRVHQAYHARQQRKNSGEQPQQGNKFDFNQ